MKDNLIFFENGIRPQLFENRKTPIFKKNGGRPQIFLFSQEQLKVKTMDVAPLRV
jgi:hypothetical protein